MDNVEKAVDLCLYRIKNAAETLDTAKLCIQFNGIKILLIGVIMRHFMQ